MSKTARDYLDMGLAQFRPSTPREEAPKEADPPGAIPVSLVRSAKVASWIAYFALMYFLWERALSVSEAKYETMAVTHIGPWADLDLAIFFPLLVGYAFVVVGVLYVAKIAIPILVSLNWKEHLWPKTWALIITVLVSVVLITGTATVGSDAIIESERDKVVAVEQVEQGRAGIQASITGAEAELKSMMENRNAYLAQAASVGEEQWVASYVAQARREKDARLPMIERATGAARAADVKRAEIKQLRQQLAMAATTASVSSEVNTARTGPLNAMLGFLNAFWVLLLAVVMDITCLIMPWIALRLEQARNRQLAAFRGEDFIAKDGRPAWADEAHMIPDMREEEKIRSGPMVPNREEVFDAETGERLVKIKPREYYRRTGGKKRDAPVEMPADPIELPDEAGVVFDSDSRAARSGVEEGDATPVPADADQPLDAEGGSAAETGLSNAYGGEADVHVAAADSAMDWSENRIEDEKVLESPDDLLALLTGDPLPAEELSEDPDFIGPPAPVEKRLGADGAGGVVTIAAE
jgi:hypothetical protein